MKCRILSLLLLSCNSSFSQPATFEQPVGLVYQLYSLKFEAEYMVSKALTDSSKAHAADRLRVVSRYNALRAFYNPFLTQIMADMIRSNSIRPYRRLDNRLRTANLESVSTGGKGRAALYLKGLQHYRAGVKALEEAAEPFHDKNFGQGIGFMEVLTFAYGFYKDQREITGKKVTAVNALLTNALLAEPQAAGKDKSGGKE